ncbi:Aromatic-di-Alanine repeat protein [Necator americanus]|uniref:Aromatic-di-Alanine repeat protein n=1 Tax=Necator americanus TaxID=51031 RepID=W2T4W3_NECAM|nr:Aromatic-di-Alanine repeat protein [Necator americanus]ETN76246.1 Aromatic-di-Alanine repeat protein [Necator americanus]
MADSEVKARRKLEEAEKKSRGGGGFLGKLFGGSGADEAADLFIQCGTESFPGSASSTEDNVLETKDNFDLDDGEFSPMECDAGNLFKMAKLWKDAGDAFVRAAEIHGSKSDSKHDCASQYAEAANCYRKVNPQVAVDCLLKTSEIYTDMGRFNMAAKNHVAIAELFESECPDTEQCIQHYQKAADYYKGEEAKSSATKCLIKVAQYAAQLEQYQKAISVFEEIALWEADHPTLKYAAKNHFFQSLLCYLCIDPLDAQHALKRYEDASPSFADTREAKLIKDLIACLEDGNEELLTDTVKAFDKVSRLDQWHTSLLVKIKRAISKEDEEDLK